MATDGSLGWVNILQGWEGLFGTHAPRDAPTPCTHRQHFVETLITSIWFLRVESLHVQCHLCWLRMQSWISSDYFFKFSLFEIRIWYYLAEDLIPKRTDRWATKKMLKLDTDQKVIGVLSSPQYCIKFKKQTKMQVSSSHSVDEDTWAQKGEACLSPSPVCSKWCSIILQGRLQDLTFVHLLFLQGLF